MLTLNRTVEFPIPNDQAPNPEVIAARSGQQARPAKHALTHGALSVFVHGLKVSNGLH